MKRLWIILVVAIIGGVCCMAETTEGDSLYLVAKSYFDKGNYKNAADEFLALLSFESDRNPEDSYNLESDRIWLAHTYYKLGNNEEARKYDPMFYELEPVDRIAYRVAAEYERNSLEASSVEMQLYWENCVLNEEKRILADDHYYLQNTYVILAQLYFQAGDEAKCREAIANAKSFESKLATTTTSWRANAYEAEAELENALGNAEAAEKAYDRAWELLDGDVVGNTYVYLECLGHYISKNFNTSDTATFNSEIESAVAKVMALDFDIYDVSDYVQFAQQITDYAYKTGQAAIGLGLVKSLLGHVSEDEEAGIMLLLCEAKLYSISDNSREAIEIENRCIDRLEALFPNRPENYVDYLMDLGESYDAAGEFDKAEETYKRAGKIYKSLGKDYRRAYIKTTWKLAVICSRRNDYEGAIGQMEDCLQMTKKLPDATDAEYALIYSELANCHNSINSEKNKQKALTYYKLACEKFEAIGEVDDMLYVRCRLGVIDNECQDFADYEKALNQLLSQITPGNIFGKQCIVIIKQALFEKLMHHMQYERAIAAINEAITVAEDLPAFDSSNLYYEKCIILPLLNRSAEAWVIAEDRYKTTEQKYGRLSEQHMEAIMLYVILSGQTFSIERMELLPEMGETVLEYLATIDKRHPKYLLFSNIAATCFEGTDADKSRSILESAITDFVDGSTNGDVGSAISICRNLADLERNSGNLDEALQYTYFMLDKSNASDSMMNMAGAYASASQTYLAANLLRDAENALLKGIEIEENSPGGDMSLFTLYKTAADLYSRIGQPDKATIYFQKLTQLSRSNENESIVYLGQTLQAIANSNQQGVEKWEDIEAIEAYVKRYPNYFDQTIPYNLKTRYYMAKGDKTEALSCLNESLLINHNINNVNLGCDLFIYLEEYPSAALFSTELLQLLDAKKGTSLAEYVAPYKRLGDIYLHMELPEESLKCYEMAFLCSAQYLKAEILTLTEKQRTDFWNSVSAFYNSYLPYVATANTFPETMNGLLYNSALFSNGFLLTANRSISNIVKGASAEVKQLYGNYLSKKMELEKGRETLCSDADLQRIQSECETAERELITSINDSYPDDMEYKQYTWQDVEHNLPARAAAIEYIDFQTDSDTNTVAALVLKKGMGMPEMRVLYHYNRVAPPSGLDLYRNSALGDSLLTAIADLLSDCQDIYFSPQGLLCSIALESLPRSESALPQDVRLYRVSSTRVLAEKRAKRKDFRATLFGGLNYDTSVESLLADAENYPELRNRGYVADNAFRANRESDAEIPPLPGTLKEVNAISDILAAGKHVKANMKVGNDGTETAFKALSGKYGSVLHVSTHGFFSAVDGRQDNAEQTFEDLALDGCGLLMAGASHRYLDEETLPNNLDDGILKASEIAKLDLKGVDLAVLSACETGLGAVTGDGVFGLQRGFKKGGVNSILMSLWKVDDDATCALMTAFYTNWLQGKSKYESLELAKAAVRAVPRWSDPQYWAAFILLDALN
jgi:CHAT domain-containing protein